MVRFPHRSPGTISPLDAFMSHAAAVSTARAALATMVLVMCACARTHPVDETSVSEGTPLRGNRCGESELMVVENRTGYPVRVRATENRMTSVPGSAMALQVIQSGVIDTIRGAPKALGTIVVFDVDRPALPSGAPMRSDRLTIRCVKS
jgi:hypothetical protein